jgi:hypothetical protein
VQRRPRAGVGIYGQASAYFTYYPDRLYSMTIPFRYEQAFSRNIGWVTPDEQAILRTKRVAIAGGGGVGGVHLLTLVRLGISKFHIADFDTFDLPNFNRQVGANMSTLGEPKADVLARIFSRSTSARKPLPCVQNSAFQPPLRHRWAWERRC